MTQIIDWFQHCNAVTDLPVPHDCQLQQEDQYIINM